MLALERSCSAGACLGAEYQYGPAPVKAWELPTQWPPGERYKYAWRASGVGYGSIGSTPDRAYAYETWAQIKSNPNACSGEFSEDGRVIDTFMNLDYSRRTPCVPSPKPDVASTNGKCPAGYELRPTCIGTYAPRMCVDPWGDQFRPVALAPCATTAPPKAAIPSWVYWVGGAATVGAVVGAAVLVRRRKTSAQ